MRRIDKALARELATVGEVSGGVAAVPGAGTAAAVALSGADIAISVTRTTDLILSIGAAHGFIRPDSAGGSPATSNGLSLCKIHHASFDHHIVGIRPDHVIEIRQDVLEEVDGPMLRYGLQALNGEKLILPKRAADKPDPEALEERYEQFLAR